MRLAQKIKQTFLDITVIDEVYPNEKEIVKYILRFLKSLGIKTTIDSFGNVIAYIPGKGESILLNTHMDIPESLNGRLGYEVKENIIRSTGKSILGADPKSGVAVLLEFARYIRTEKIQTCPIELVFTRGEEPGLLGAIHLDYSLLTSRYGLVLDEDGPCTNIVIQAPYFYKLDVTVTGKTVHPRDFREGVDALIPTAQVIAALPQGEAASGVTFNMGIVHAGTARNSTVGEVTIQAELRSFSKSRMVKEAKKIEKKFASLRNAGLSVTLDGIVELDGFQILKDDLLLKRLNATYKSVQLEPHFYETYGGSDASILNAHGISVVPIGSGYYNAHQYSEYVNIEEMEQLLHFLVRFVEK